MKSLTTYFVLVNVLVSFTFGAFDHVIAGGYRGSMILNNESLLVTGGGVLEIDAKGSSYIEVHNTTPLEQSVGGIYVIDLDHSSTMNYYGGETGAVYLYKNATATFSGGRIDYLSSFQFSSDIRHITFVCDLDTVSYTGGVLTGNWLDGTSFSITLVDRDGYDSVYSNIQFVPEPATLVLLGIGGILMRRKK